VPWLKKIAEENEASAKTHALGSIGAYLGLSLLFVGGAIYFAFLRKSPGQGRA
jgi:hypothetical protein